ncbi:MAG TPA: peroxidase-related enzyme [Rhodothermales bacterium]|nr:peroxidase-related enzyme [Rhodothermales bacterium]
MSWIKTQSYDESDGTLRKLYDRVKGPDEDIDNILQVHSLRPHTLAGHMALYKNVLHHSSNTLPKWLLETIGVYVSLLNKCSYCVEHHFEGLRALLDDDARATAIRKALETNTLTEVFDAREQAVLGYAWILTRVPAEMTPHHLGELRMVGLTDGEILEVNQVTGYFAYANRTVLGLGVITEGDILGRSPSNSDNPDDWQHR